ncbi:polysaccharide deacetylase family protein [Nocardioides piscis]|uniref:Polysaccharide deacetylase family protein n=1 Tax=Nocardioides piscis TaxID=2714938 RepID=A0A6G7YF29_9ACTN|nr:polysaccharide deacetylase family protein [Nocardioides piscis]
MTPIKSRIRSVLRSAALDVLGSSARIGSGVHLTAGHFMGPTHEHPAERFDRLLTSLGRVASLVRIEDALDAIQAGARPRKPMIAFTFDDGYRDWVTHIAPVLESHRVNALFFVNPGLVGLPRDRGGVFETSIGGGIANKTPLSPKRYSN